MMEEKLSTTEHENRRPTNYQSGVPGNDITLKRHFLKSSAALNTDESFHRGKKIYFS